MLNALCLKEWTVTEIHESEMAREMVARYEIHPDSCPKCGVVGRLYRHGTKKVKYTDAPNWGKHSVLTAIVNRYRCRDCAATSMQPLPDVDGQRQMTKRCIEHIEKQGVPQTYAALARQIGVDEKTVRNICNLKFERQIAERIIETPRILGIDELTLLGRKRTIFVDVGARRLLDMIDSMNRSRVDRWLYNLPDPRRVCAVMIDMWGPYKNSVQAQLPNAKIIVDKWHVLSKLNQALDKVRNWARRQAGIRKNPRKGRRLLQTSRHNLTPKTKALVDALLASNPLLDAAWHAKEAFYDVFAAKERAAAEQLFEAWKDNIPDAVRQEFEPIAKMVDNWHAEIFAFFDYPLTNAYTEARNGLIKIANRAGRGYSFDTIRAKALLMETSEKLCECPVCKGQYPESSFKTLKILIGDHVKSEEVSNEICTNCHYYFHTHLKPKWDRDFVAIPH